MDKVKLGVLLVGTALGVHAQSTGVNHPATDDLGRALPTYEEAGPVRPDKTVAMFFWTWHAGHSTHSKDYDLSRILKHNPEMSNDWDHPLWARYTGSGSFFWTEPLFDFYDGKDKWVIRKQLEMLGAAGVDVLFYDATNGDFTWKPGYEAVAEVMAEARADGVDVPQFAFMLPFAAGTNTASSLSQLYDDLYKPGKYRDSWFIWHGKPVVMAYPESMDLAGLPDEIKAKAGAIKDFFTFRPGQPTYDTGPRQPDHWGWLENAPQHGYVKKESGGYELMTVGVAQNWSEETHGLSAMSGRKIHGRSYTKADGFSRLTDDSYLYGYNFQEQWDRALEVDPDMVFITGWNEWVMGRFESWQEVENAFPDAFDKEHSRDIEPMKGGYGDNYYYQMVDNIRKFKGMEKPEPASGEKTISIDGKFDDWVDVVPSFKDSKGDAGHRDGYGYIDKENPGQHLHYTNDTGRNDIVGAKIARDEKNLCFLVETAASLTSHTDEKWMQLLIDIDRDKVTGWKGYDFVISSYGSDGKAELGKSSMDWKWAEAGRVDYKAAGSKMEIAIPRDLLNLPEGKPLDLEFKWMDNVDPSADIMQFYLDGDVAPLGRFNYRYVE
ncbi:MAG: hypothetical protein ABFR33_10930 [Verrucomicrobiota bacterium]